MTMNLKQLVDFDSVLPVEVARFLMGEAGIGKSSAVKLLAKLRGYNFVDLRLSELEPADLVGMPFVDHSGPRPVTKYAAPEWFVSLFDGPTVLFLDETDRAREDMQPLAMQLTLDRRCGGRDLPADTIVFAAGNGLKYQVSTLDQALVNRFAMIDFMPSHAEWVNWASKPESQVHTSVVQFITEHEKMLDIPTAKIGVPNEPVTTRRSWATLGRVLSGVNVADRVHELSQSMTLMNWAAPFIGGEAALAFNTWVQTSYKPLDINRVMDGSLTDTKGYTLPQLIDALGPINERINEKTTTDEQRVNAMLFYANFSMESFSALIERLDPSHGALITNPRIKPHIEELLAIHEKLADTVKEEKASREAKASGAVADTATADADGSETKTKGRKKKT